MPGSTNRLTRFLQLLQGTSARSPRERRARLLLIAGLTCLLVLVLVPITVLALQDASSGQTTGKTSHGATSGATRPANSSPSPGKPVANAPMKGLTDNPAYQWWRWPNHPQPDSFWGDQQTEQSLGAQIQLMQELGVKMFRVELVWSFVAPTMPGGATYDSASARNPNWSGYQWSRWDMIVRLTSAAGIQLLPQVVYTPDWASGVTTTTTGGGPNNHPLSAQFYGDFVYATVTRYKGQIHFWEMWNEPDIPADTWKDSATGSLQTYVDLILKPGYQAVKQADQTAKVVLGGLAGGFDMQKIYAASGKSYFDIGNFHQYAPAAGGVAAAMDQARGAMNVNGDRNKPLWLTEFGLKTQPDGSGPINATPDVPADETAQATMITSVFAFKGVRAVFYYQLHDTSVYNASGAPIKDVYWGLVSHDLSVRKPGFDAFKAAPVGDVPPLT